MNIIIHYDEIGLKGKNRGIFEKRLVDHIKLKLREKLLSYKYESGQITLEIKEKTDEIKKILQKIPGISYFSFAQKTDPTPESISKKAIELMDGDYKTFKIDTKRRVKTYSFTSMELSRDIGADIVEKYNKKVNLTNPEKTLKIELTKGSAYLSDDKIKGVGGLPISRKQKVVCLLSGGIDSPVAAYLMMKRGCEVIFIHFQNQTTEEGFVKNKIENLAKILSDYQHQTNLYIVPFAELQKKIIVNVPAEMRMLIYRGAMIKLAGELAKKERAKFLIVGDSLSQVASQTFENLAATYSVSEYHIFSPLIGMDKKEIIKISQEIGTYETSILPYSDCCTFLMPKSPKLNTRPRDIREKLEKVEFNPEEEIGKAKLIEF